MEASPDQVLTKPEAAIWLRLADPDADPGELESACRAIEHLVQQRRIRPLKVGRRHFFTRRELEAFCLREVEAQDLD